MAHGTRTKYFEDGSVSEVTNVIDLREKDAPQQIFNMIKTLVDFEKDGFTKSHIQTRYSLEDMATEIIVDFHKGRRMEVHGRQVSR